MAKSEKVESRAGIGGADLAKLYQRCERLSKSEDTTVAQLAADSSFELQRAYLQEHSAAYTSWRDSAVTAGLIDV